MRKDDDDLWFFMFIHIRILIIRIILIQGHWKSQLQLVFLAQKTCTLVLNQLFEACIIVQLNNSVFPYKNPQAAFTDNRSVIHKRRPEENIVFSPHALQTTRRLSRSSFPSLDQRFVDRKSMSFPIFVALEHFFSISFSWM